MNIGSWIILIMNGCSRMKWFPINMKYNLIKYFQFMNNFMSFRYRCSYSHSKKIGLQRLSFFIMSYCPNFYHAMGSACSFVGMNYTTYITSMIQCLFNHQERIPIGWTNRCFCTKNQKFHISFLVSCSTIIHKYKKFWLKFSA